ncbi:hypothetical protein J6590_104736 [Homalodisca vitripennis]|nr:hypothetical protein J6590_104736 [Homalodisca vitripennis]
MEFLVSNFSRVSVPNYSIVLSSVWLYPRRHFQLVQGLQYLFHGRTGHFLHLYLGFKFKAAQYFIRVHKRPRPKTALLQRNKTKENMLRYHSYRNESHEGTATSNEICKGISIFHDELGTKNDTKKSETLLSYRAYHVQIDSDVTLPAQFHLYQSYLAGYCIYNVLAHAHFELLLPTICNKNYQEFPLGFHKVTDRGQHRSGNWLFLSGATDTCPSTRNIPDCTDCVRHSQALLILLLRT